MLDPKRLKKLNHDFKNIHTILSIVIQSTISNVGITIWERQWPTLYKIMALLTCYARCWLNNFTVTEDL